jgi:hypothetical protein
MSEEINMDVAQLINDFGFPVVMAVGLGYFIYYVWWFIGEKIDPQIEEMHMALIRVIDQTRMLDQDMIRLQQKVDVVLEYRARQEVLEDAEKEKAFEKQKKTTKG